MNRFGDASGALLAALLAIGSVAARSAPALAATPDLYSYTVSVGDGQPTAVIFDGQSIWVAIQGTDGGTVEKLTATGQVVSSTRVGDAPIEMAYDGVNVWVTNYSSSTLTIVGQNGELLKTIFLPLAAHPEGILFDGKYIWIANNGAGVNTVSKFDAVGRTFIANYPVGNAPDGLSFDGTYVWVTNSYSNNVMKLDRETGEIVRTYPTGTYPLSIIAVGADMWIGNGAVDAGLPPLAAASVTELRVNGGVNLGTFAAGNAVRGLAYDGSSIWACNSLSDSFTRIRASDGYPLGSYPTGRAPRGIAFDGVRMWIANSADSFLTVVTPEATPIEVTPGVQVFSILSRGVLIVPKLLPALASGGAPFEAGVTAGKPRVSPAVAALGGILDSLLDSN
jgi:YVTN family beta-propeller protein